MIMKTHLRRPFSNLSSFRSFGKTSLILASLIGGSLIGGTQTIDSQVGFDRPILHKTDPDVVALQVKLTSDARDLDGDRLPVNLTLVVDRSGSMSGAKLTQALAGAEVALRSLQPDDRFAVVVYNDKPQTLIQNTEITEHNRRKFVKMLRSLKAEGGTAIYAGVEEGAEQIQFVKRDGYVNRIVLLSDGLANEGPSSPSAFRRLGQRLVGKRIGVSTIGLGLDYDEDIMAALAGPSDGSTYFVEHSEDLQRIFASELGDALSVAATDIQVTISLPKGLRPVRGIGREMTVAGDTAQFKINQTYAGVDKIGLLEVAIDDYAVLEKKASVDVVITYKDALGKNTQSFRRSAELLLTDDEALATASINAEIVENVVANRVAEAKTEAIDYADAGNDREAAAKLSFVAQAISDTYEDVDAHYFQKELEQLEAGATSIQADGFSNRMRKSYRSESYQSINQQRVK